jgi:hypothetical protein
MVDTVKGGGRANDIDMKIGPFYPLLRIGKFEGEKKIYDGAVFVNPNVQMSGVVLWLRSGKNLIDT